ncbi:MAG TPA: glycosyltransferase [Deltaproteobacteria bacterium]|nr:glycosyltransferase [Deltaproteobacteria bacterium]
MTPNQKNRKELWGKEFRSLEGRILEIRSCDSFSHIDTIFPSAVLHRISPAKSKAETDTTGAEATGHQWPFENNFFNCILIPDGFETLPDLAWAIQESYRVLKPGGRLVGTSIPDIPTFRIDQYERQQTNKEQILIDCTVRLGFRQPQWRGTSIWNGADGNKNVYFTATKYVRSNTMVSVVILCHNQAGYLRRSIHAALAQTYDPYEIIVVNNGSTDSSGEILKEFGDRIRVITREKGLPGSINAGFEAARGDYFTWTGSDNVMFPHMLDVLAGHLDTYQDAAGVYSDNALIDNKGRFLYNMHRPDYNPNLLLDVSRQWLIGISFMFRRDVFESVQGCDLSLQFGEDYDLWLKIASRYQIRHIPDQMVLMAYHDHSSGMSDEERQRRCQGLDYTRHKAQEIRKKYIQQISEFTNGQIQPV